jgi:acetaldehyde dehydrogenase
LSIVKGAIIGSGAISADLLSKIGRLSTSLAIAVVAAVDAESDGLVLARQLGIPTTVDGVEGLVAMSDFEDIKIVLDATSTEAHPANAAKLAAYDKQIIGLTPAGIGPFVVPSVNLEQHLDAPYVSMVTCGGQSTVPIVAAISRITPVHYGEIVTTVAAQPPGRGAQAHIDKLAETTSAAIEVVGGAARGKAIMVVNSAERQLIMRDTVRCLTDRLDDQARDAVKASIDEMVAAVAAYIPGYRLKQLVQIWTVAADEAATGRSGDLESGDYDEVSVFLQVEDAPASLPGYVDMMTSAACLVAERMALRHST